MARAFAPDLQVVFDASKVELENHDCCDVALINSDAGDAVELQLRAVRPRPELRFESEELQ